MILFIWSVGKGKNTNQTLVAWELTVAGQPFRVIEIFYIL